MRSDYSDIVLKVDKELVSTSKDVVYICCKVNDDNNGDDDDHNINNNNDDDDDTKMMMVGIDCSQNAR